MLSIFGVRFSVVSCTRNLSQPGIFPIHPPDGPGWWREVMGPRRRLMSRAAFGCFPMRLSGYLAARPREELVSLRGILSCLSCFHISYFRGTFGGCEFELMVRINEDSALQQGVRARVCLRLHLPHCRRRLLFASLPECSGWFRIAWPVRCSDLMDGFRIPSGVILICNLGAGARQMHAANSQ